MKQPTNVSPNLYETTVNMKTIEVTKQTAESKIDVSKDKRPPDQGVMER